VIADNGLSFAPPADAMQEIQASQSMYRSRAATVVAVALLSVHATLLAWSARCHSPVFNEAGHLASGLYHLQTGRFELFRVNPPLVRMIAALPVAMAGIECDWSFVGRDPFVRYEYQAGELLLLKGEPSPSRYFTLARWACIPFSLLGGCVCWRWSAALFGEVSGLVALTLWCFSPYMLGHASLITADAASAALGLLSLYTFRHWVVVPSWNRSFGAGITLGLAQLTKFTLLSFYLVIPLCWIAYYLGAKRSEIRRPLRRDLAMLACMAVLSLYVINAGYTFRGAFRALGSYAFQSEVLSGGSVESDNWYGSGNRFAKTSLRHIPIPLPEDYLQGIDTQSVDFERGKYSYLRGEWRHKGWWYFYLYALAVKVPLGTWLLAMIAVVLVALNKSYRVSLADELCLLLPAAAILALVSSQTGISVHSRYMLPVLPFVFVSISRVGKALSEGPRSVVFVSAGALLWMLTSSLYCVPHCLSYFNELAGGPRNGHRHLLDSNLAWNQDLLYLKSWYDDHPEARPVHVAAFGLADPELFGIEFSAPPKGPGQPVPQEAENAQEMGPVAGWFVIDVNHLYGTHYNRVPDRNARQCPAGTDTLDLSHFQRFRPYDRVGYSIVVYRITLEEANRVRRELGLPELPVDWEREQERVPR
jgi:hypothetical protein